MDKTKYEEMKRRALTLPAPYKLSYITAPTPSTEKWVFADGYVALGVEEAATYIASNTPGPKGVVHVRPAGSDSEGQLSGRDLERHEREMRRFQADGYAVASPPFGEYPELHPYGRRCARCSDPSPLPEEE
jgi:hypothetical protein